MDFLELLVNLSLRACLPAALAAAVLLFSRLRLPQTRHAVWTAVLVCMFLQIPLHPLLPPLPLRVLRPAPVQTVIADAGLRPLPTPRAAARRSRGWPPTAEQTILILYAVGVLFGIVRLAAGYRFSRRVLQSAAPVEVPDAAASVLESASIAVPMTNGWVAPRILLPAAWRAWDLAKLHAVLAHEQAHIQRRDWPIALFARLNKALFWFHPLAWWLERHLAALAEQACDDAAIAHTGDRHRYAQALVEIAQDAQASSGRFLLTAMAKNAGVHERIDSILDESRPVAIPLRRRFWLALACTAIVGAYLTSAVQLAPAQQPASSLGPYQKWLTEDVAYIVTDAERAAFASLKDSAEREMFIEQFWLRRDPTPGTAENEFKQEHYRRIGYGNQRFRTLAGLAGWKTDRGRIYINYGPPDEIESHPSGGSHQFLIDTFGPAAGDPADTSPYEVWHYKGGNIWFGFIDRDRTGDYRIVSSSVRPKIAFTRQPEYTEAARAARIQGAVVLTLTIAADGSPQNIRVTQSLDPGLDEKAIECVRGWRFHPALIAGIPVAGDIAVQIIFRLP